MSLQASGFISLLLAATTMSGQQVRYNWARSANFSSYKVYKWVVLPESKVPDVVIDKQIQSVTDAELAMKGLSMVAYGDVDLFVAYQGAVAADKELTLFDTRRGYGPGWYLFGWCTHPADLMKLGQTSTISVGQLALDMYDARSHDLVWRGIASKTLNVTSTFKKRQKVLERGVRKLLQDYPPIIDKIEVLH